MRPFDPDKEFYTTAEVAHLIGVTAPTIIKWIKQGRISASKTPGGHRRIAASEAVRLMSESKDQKEQPGSRADCRDIKVMVLDPEVDFAEMVAEFLGLQMGVQAKWSIDLVDIGYEFATFQPDIVLCATEMPALGSITQYADRIKARLVVLNSVRNHSAGALREDLSDAIVVKKPVKLESLLQIIREL